MEAGNNMKKFIYSVLAISSILAVSCTKPELGVDLPGNVELVPVSISANAGTKATVEDMRWSGAESIAVLVKSAAGEYEGTTLTADVKEPAAATVFEGLVAAPQPSDVFLACYPAETFNNGVATFAIPAVQTENADAKPILVAKYEGALSDISFDFAPVTALLNVTAPVALTKVVFEGLGGENISGNFTWDGENVVNAFGGTTITYENAQGATAVKLLVPAMTLQKGYKLTLTSAEGTMLVSVSAGKAISFEAGQRRNANLSSFVPVSVEVSDIRTSYTEYTTNGAAAGNAVAANAVAAVLDFKGISSALVTEYGIKVGETLVKAGDSAAQNHIEIPFTAISAFGTSYGEKSIQLYVKVGNDLFTSASATAIITGLPYKAEPPSTTRGWTGNGEWNNGYVRLNSNDSITLTLFTKEDIDVSLEEKLSINGKTLTLKYYLDVSGVRIASYERTYGRTTTHNEKFDTTIKSTNPTIKCTSDANWASTSYADLSSIVINYR